MFQLNRFYFLMIILYLLIFIGCRDSEVYNKEIFNREVTEMKPAHYENVIKLLKPLHKKLDAPKAGDWLYQHDEPGQTFREYLAANPEKPDEKRRTIYILPLGDFSRNQQEILSTTVMYIRVFYNLDVKLQKAVGLSSIPKKYIRTHPTWGMKQVLTGFITEGILKPNIPDDAIAYIAVTTSDLWPGEGWNFVFGEASLTDKVGVFSIYRYGDADGSATEYRSVLRRTMAVATHELGHMFGILHCKEYECNMNGSNSLDESDSRPIWLCPECMAKVCWYTGADPVNRYEKLDSFFNELGFTTEADFMKKSAVVLSSLVEDK